MNIILFSENDRIGVSNFVFYKNDERYFHIKKILRLAVGSSFKCGIIGGKQGQAIITVFTNEELLFSFKPLENSLPLLPINLILGAIRPIQLKRLLKDVSTIGISSIHIVGTILGEKSYLNSTLIEKDNITKYLIEGASQAGSTLIPNYQVYPSLRAFLKSKNAPVDGDIKIVFDLVSSIETSLKSNLENFRKSSQNQKIYLAIGSERGWSIQERTMFSDKDFESIKLGNRILRTETATIASISYIFSKIGIY